MQFRNNNRTTMRTTFRKTSLVIIMLVWTSTTDAAKKSGEITVTCTSCRSRQSELRGVQGGDVTINFHINTTKFVVFEVFFSYTFFCRQLNFPSKPGVANEILENEPKSCLTVACCLIFGQNLSLKAISSRIV